MKKIPTLFARDEATNRRYVRDEVTPGCEWVLAGEGVATRKFDGVCTRFDGQFWWVRREVSMDAVSSQRFPEGFVLVGYDTFTGKGMGWEPAHRSGFYQYIIEAAGDEPWLVGTYELCGPKINRNPEWFKAHTLVPHGAHLLDHRPEDNAPRTFDGLGVWLVDHAYEGIVWYSGDGRMAKLKRKDFPS